jgi:hypothetical protein
MGKMTSASKDDISGFNRSSSRRIEPIPAVFANANNRQPRLLVIDR